MRAGVPRLGLSSIALTIASPDTREGDRLHARLAALVQQAEVRDGDLLEQARGPVGEVSRPRARHAQTQLSRPAPPAHSRAASRSCSALERLVGVRGRAAEALPGRVEDLVVAGRAGASWAARFWPPDSHCTIGHGIAHGPPGPRWRRRRGRGRRAGDVSSRSASRRPAAGAAERGQAGGVRAGERVAGGRAGPRDRRRARRGACGRRRASRSRRSASAVSTVLLAAGVGAGVAHEVEQARVGALDAAHERQRLEQLREAVGVQDDGDEVRASRPCSARAAGR